MTKTHEEFILGRLEDTPFWSELKGEVTVLLGPAEPGTGAMSEAEVLALLDEESARGGRPKDVVKRVKDKARGWTAKALYELLNARKDDELAP